MRAALEHDDAARDFGGVSGEDGGDADAFEQGAGLVWGEAGEAELTECSTERPAAGVRRWGRAGWRGGGACGGLVSARLMSRSKRRRRGELVGGGFG